MSKLATMPGFVRVDGRLLKKSDIILIEQSRNSHTLIVTMSGRQDPVEIGHERLGDFIKKMKREDEDEQLHRQSGRGVGGSGGGVAAG